ncbi:trace amine-associated receptor 13c-like protein [Labeo rohita]|uniref:Trace amine-associated receptor 13c-like protein n=1 Tax=Labeo rohita TaxID=84645 RepID=A0A498NKA1_LABRO|nr:trace amine-associated receptor 13c-like protein [Labeo rohita]
MNNSCLKGTHHVFVQTVVYLLLVLAMLVTVLGNSVVIISIAHFRQLQTPTNILVMSLALADLLLGLVVMPFSMIRSVDGCWYYGDAFCLLHSTFDLFLTSVSIFHLIFIAIDRHQAVCYPLQYPTRITIPVAWVMTVLYLILVSAMTVTILGNLVVIISIAHFKQLQTPTNILVMSLALADLLLGLVVMPFSMIRSVDGCWYYGDAFCLLHSTFDFLTSLYNTLDNS